MRPIKLKIKGLNSFIEEQTIDFNKLTDRGLFGIFGPTGSGKSTVLDGITLALYGDVSRKSSNYINTNCERLNVSFEFKISGSEIKTYKVLREFKRNKQGNPVSGKCKIVDIINEEEVLADKVTTVNDKCREIIGLSLDDFTRTVVLPQGKFSDFLKLEGKQRREMLERLFNLQEYGDNLSRKLSREINKEKTENSVLLGQLKGYEDISEDKKKEKSEELNLSIESLATLNKELKIVEESFNVSQELWNMQLEVNSYKKTEKELVERADEIENYKEKVKLGEGANRVNPYILTYNDTIKNIEVTEKELSELNLKVEELKDKKSKAEEKWSIARSIKDNELPTYKIKEEKIKEAIEDKKALAFLDAEITEIKSNEEALLNRKKEDEYKVSDSEERLKRGNNLIKEQEVKRETLNIDTDLKNKVQQGLVITRDYEKYLKSIGEYKVKIEKLTELIRKSREYGTNLKEELEKKSKILVENKNILEELIKNCPGNQNDLLELQNLYSESKNKLEDYNKAKNELVKYKNYIDKSNEQLKEIKINYSNLEKEIDELKTSVREIETENLAYRLRESLKSGDVCPVCGSVEHYKENIKYIEAKDIALLENDIKIKEKCLKDIAVNITKIETNQGIANDTIKENESVIISLGEGFNEAIVKDIEAKFNDLKIKINYYNLKKEALELQVNTLKEENYNLDIKHKQLEAETQGNEKQLNEIQEDYKILLNELENTEKQLNILKDETKVNDFKIKNEEILEIEKEREKVEKTLKSYRERLEELTKTKESALNDLNITNQNLVKVQSTLDERIKFREEKLEQIKSKVEDIYNIDQLLESIQKVIKKIEDDFNNAEKLKEEADKTYQECNNNIISITARNAELYKRKSEEKEKLDKVLKEENFLNVDEVIKNILDKNSIEALKSDIDRYNNDLAKVRGAIESISKKIEDRILTEEQWISIQEEKKLKEEQVNELNEIKIRLEQEVKDINNKLLELKDILGQKEKLDHKLALLNDLDKLFKGKKFVEFVAATRLKYVSIEASKRLKEITNGNYGLEVDEDGRFLIRDYKNGGAGRDASTLSGGETFLASLALALALSAEIQLKGTAPLELFFLDEGFGTLDDNLLEVVMSSLEKIHNDKLKVGIISHVETIKNRVPVKLMITPAEAGLGGSKVKIERS